MKQIILLCIVFFLQNIKSISQPFEDSTYYAENYINKFEGTWKWVNGNDEIIIKLKKFRHSFSTYDEDILLGSHSYSQNGVIIESSLNDFDAIPSDHKKRSVFLWNDPTESINKTIGVIKDLSKHTSFYTHLEYVVGANPEQLVVQIKDKNEFLTKPEQQLGNTLPTSFILTKQ